MDVSSHQSVWYENYEMYKIMCCEIICFFVFISCLFDLFWVLDVFSNI